MNSALYPDYYRNFACLMADCRLNCCRESWEIPLMREEYEAMRSAGRKNSELAGLMGRALAREGAPQGAYAHIRHEDGACPLCTDEGLCRLHAACGAEALGSVCRTFPRGHVLWNGSHRQSCSAGCQGTLALLQKRQEPLTFVTGDFVADGWQPNRGSFALPAALVQRRPMLARLEELQQDMAAVLQQRAKPFVQRMGELAAGLYQLDQDERTNRPNAAFAPQTAAQPAQDSDPREALAAVALFTTPFLQLGTAREQAFIAQVWQACGVELYSGPRGTGLRLNAATYQTAAAKRDALWNKQAPHLWEHLMVNQMFHNCLPFGDGTTGIWENALYFCAVYAILRFLAAGCAARDWAATEDALVRGLRKYTHSTQLLPRTVEQLKRRGMDTPEGLAALLAL